MDEDLNSEAQTIGAVPGSVYPLPGGQCVFRADFQSTCRVITRQVLEALEVCSRFRTLDGQVAAVTGAIGELEGRESEVRRVLDGLADMGLLQPAGSFLEPFRSAAAGSGRLEDVVIRTAGSDALAHLLSSLADNERRHGNRYRYWVLDDADVEEGSERSAAMTASARDDGLDCRFVSRKEQEAHVRRLLEAAGTPDAGWLFETPGEGGFTGGRVWNLALVMLAGRRFVLLDDDLVCAARQRPDTAMDLRLAPADWSLWFHRDREDAAASGEASDTDPLAEHGGFLGANLGQVVATLFDGGEPSLDSRELAKLDPAAPVVATAHGTYGDAASATNLWLYTTAGESRERFWATRETYDQCRRSRWVTRLRPGHTLLPRPTFTPAGLDGSGLLPPTLPMGRDEDFLFGVLLERTHPGSRTLNFPWALGHFPEGRRRWETEPHEYPITPNMGRFIADNLLAAGDAGQGASPASRLRLAADQAAGIAAEPDRDLQARLDEYLLYARSDLVSQLQRRMAEAPDAPVYWAADVRRIVETNGRALSAARAPRLAGMPENDLEGLSWLRAGLSRFAAACAAWPTVWRHAVELGAPPD